MNPGMNSQLAKARIEDLYRDAPHTRTLVDRLQALRRRSS